MTVLVSRLHKYWRDLGAVLVLALALVTLFGLVGLSSGTVLSAWAAFLRGWLGWGAMLVPVTLGWIGWVQLLANLRGPAAAPRLRWGRIIYAEGAAIALLGILNLAIGSNAALAASGLGGGQVGWGIGYVLAAILPPPADLLLLLALFLFGLFLATDVTADRLGRLLDWLQSFGFAGAGGGTQPDVAPDRQAAPGSPAAEPATTRDTAPARKHKAKIAANERVRVPVETVQPVVKTKQKKRPATLPSLDLFDNREQRRPAQKEIDETGSIIIKTLKEFGVPVNVIGARVGPSVTQYQVEPGFVERPGPDGASKQWKVRVAQISSLADDLALALSANTLRIEAPVPGQNYVGIEVPHRRTATVSLRPVMESDGFQKVNSPLAVALGRDVSGAAIAADLGKMPHLLISGTTGSGKSVCIASLVTCLVTNNTPDDLRMVLIDPKMVELVRFNGLPHLFGKVETDLDRITGVLRWVTREMDRRYKVFETVGARNLETYNNKAAKKASTERLPRIVVMIDELADLMMRAPDETERTVVRLAQMARATGIHLVVATQRPSTDIVTGLIKANFPARISFAVTSMVDSRVILDTPGAESLLGRGDMLYLSPEAAAPMRLQGCFVSDREIDRIVAYWKEQAAESAEPLELSDDDQAAPVETDPNAPPDALPAGQAPWDAMLAREAVVEDKDGQIEQAIAIVKKYGNASASLLQRKMRIGYPRAARLMDELRDMGIVGREQTGGKTREVFVRGDDDPIGERAARLMSGVEEDDVEPLDEG
ncbi:MAG: DNA translocase FtsK [Anaerolineales bacterium]|nr:DNA translocase FtsK [Anaerolineales bacterium]